MDHKEASSLQPNAKRVPSWLTRKVAVPMWGLSLLCLLCVCFGLAYVGAEGSQNTASAQSPTATSTQQQTAFNPPTATNAASATHTSAPSASPTSSTPRATATTAPTSTSGPAPSPTATSRPQPTATPRPQPTATTAPTWKTVQTYSGNGDSNTAAFTANASQWRILWSCNPAAYGSEYNLIADLTVPGQQFGNSVVNVICKDGQPDTESGQTMEYTQGTFYLAVISEASWTFQVQLYK